MKVSALLGVQNWLICARTATLFELTLSRAKSAGRLAAIEEGRDPSSMSGILADTAYRLLLA